jgi:NAD(P)-dependent dehydrogenase (short-subunit alcohol dehydrogenase family)
MRVFVAGATGAIGRYLVLGLITAGHEVTGTTRSPARAAGLAAAGATPVIVDGLDRRAVLDAVKTTQPDVIVHQMTALASMRDFPNFGMFCGELVVALITEARGAANAKAELGWAPGYPGWRDGFPAWAGKAQAA